MIHEDGIYFHLDESEYHADPALGSSNLREFITSPRRYWMSSSFNPDRYQSKFDEEDTKATLLGRAMHTYLLQPKLFPGKYILRPKDFAGATPADKASMTKLIKSKLQPGQSLLHADEWDFVHNAAAVVGETMEGLFVGGDHEVSIFWTNDELKIRCKCRFDILKPEGVGDLKSIATRGRSIELSAKMAIRYTGLTIQAEHYLEGRSQVPKLVKAGKVFACLTRGTAEPLGHPNNTAAAPYIERIVAVSKEANPKFVFIFVGKEFPECWACVLSRQNPLMETARAQIDEALRLFATLREEYGTKPWPQMWSLRELAAEELPGGVIGW